LSASRNYKAPFYVALTWRYADVLGVYNGAAEEARRPPHTNAMRLFMPFFIPLFTPFLHRSLHPFYTLFLSPFFKKFTPFSYRSLRPYHTVVRALVMYRCLRLRFDLFFGAASQPCLAYASRIVASIIRKSNVHIYIYIYIYICIYMFLSLSLSFSLFLSLSYIFLYVNDIAVPAVMNVLCTYVTCMPRPF
jgi:hypothetical protein